MYRILRIFARSCRVSHSSSKSRYGSSQLLEFDRSQNPSLLCGVQASVSIWKANPAIEYSLSRAQGRGFWLVSAVTAVGGIRDESEINQHSCVNSSSSSQHAFDNDLPCNFHKCDYILMVLSMSITTNQTLQDDGAYRIPLNGANRTLVGCTLGWKSTVEVSDM